MELIDKNALIDWFMPYLHNEECIAPDVLIDDISRTPCVDAVPVIRCASCMFSAPDRKPGERWCNLHDTSMRDNSFCSFGRKKGN